MAQDLVDYFDEIKALSDRASLSSYDFYSQNLRRWYEALDEAPEPISGRVRWLEAQSDFEQLSKEVLADPEGMVGSGSIKLPDAREARLSFQLQLFRRLADGRLDAIDFAHDYFYVSSNRYDDLVAEMSRHLFDPFSDELIRLLKRRVNDPLPEGIDIPASDRIVPLNHNSPDYINLSGAISQAEEALASTNIGDPEDRDLAKAELGAAKRLLLATRVRLDFFARWLGTTLKWIALKFAEGSLAALASAALVALGAFLKGLLSS